MKYPKQRVSRKAYRPYTNKEWLYEQYITMNKPASQIAKEVGCKEDTIKDWVKRHDIKKGGFLRGKQLTKQYHYEDYLRKEYFENKKTITDIANENSVDNCTIISWFKKYNIEYDTRRGDDSSHTVDEKMAIDMYNNKKSINQIAQYFGCTRKRIRNVLIRNNIKIRNMSESIFCISGKEKPAELCYDWLYYHYITLHENSKDIGKILNINQSVIINNLRIFGIEVRDRSESKVGIMCGSKHPNWKGGKCQLTTLLREYFGTNIAPIALKRDNYICQRCGKPNTKLHVHHIVHFKDIVDDIISENPSLSIEKEEDKLELYKIITKDERFLNTDNLITLCVGCHKKIHSKKTISSQASSEEGSETIESRVGE